MMTEIGSIPVVINSRDRLEPMRHLINWLYSANMRNIWICDNASSYPPLLEFLSGLSNVVYLDRNLGHRAPWLSGLVPRLGRNSHFIVTDPDVVPDENCPKDAVAHFYELLKRYPHEDKVGFGLKIDDLPSHYAHRSRVFAWESQFWKDELEPGVFRAPIDTTFALYRPGLGHSNNKALRTGAPYVARHTPWYVNSVDLSEEQRWYVDHADKAVSNWDQSTLPAWLRLLADNCVTDLELHDDSNDVDEAG